MYKDIVKMSSDEEIETESQQELATTDEVLEGRFDVNSEGQYVKQKDKQPPYSNKEMMVVWSWFENRYEDLYGTGKGSNIGYEHDEVWRQFAKEVDAGEEGRNKRTFKCVWKRLDNMKYRGKT